MHEIDAVVFDMDGVLVDARDWHFHALNDALKLFGYEIDYSEHLSRYDGLPTSKKLIMLSNEHGLPVGLHSLISECKQEFTMKYVAQYCHPKPNILAIVGYFKQKNLKIGLATNSIRRTTHEMMRKSGLLPYFDSILTNEDVARPKPHPEIYLKSFETLGVESSRTIVFEDNLNGFAAAEAARGWLYKVKDPDNFFLDEVLDFLEIKKL
jgi:HAD superfamily hydrolase (TIGR01509 family)